MSYWSRTLQQRLPRRRALAAAGGLSLGAAFLAACGGSDSSSSGSSDGAPKSNLIAKPEDTSKQAKRGGTLKTYITTDVGSWDPYLRGAWFGTLGAVVFSRLTVVKPGLGGASDRRRRRRPGGELGDLARRPHCHIQAASPTRSFHPIAPVNGRTVDAQDVTASWERWKSISGTRATVDNTASPDAPVQTVTATDARTVVMKLAFPSVTLPSLISASVGQAFHITPKESAGGYNARNVAIGSGPFYVSEQVPSSRVHFKRNPGYHDDPRPYVDVAEYPVITEYATGLAAFKSRPTSPLRRPLRGHAGHEEVTCPTSTCTRSDAAAHGAHVLRLQARERRHVPRQAPAPGLLAVYGPRPVRRDLVQRLQVHRRRPSRRHRLELRRPCDEFAGWWLDPKGKDFGPNAKYYKHDVAEAKKLISAAGFANGVTYQSTRAGGNYGPEYDRQIDITEAMAADAGFKPTANVVNYQNVLIPQYQEVRGEFDGIGWMLRPQSSSDPIDKLAEYMFSGSGPNFIGFDPQGKGDHAGDPTVDDLIRKSRIERDTNKRKQIMYRHPAPHGGRDVLHPCAGRRHRVRPGVACPA